MNYSYNSVENARITNFVSQQSQSNSRFVYVKPPIPVPYNGFSNSKVLVNPHFKKTVFINPNFTKQEAVKPKIHINPKVQSLHLNKNIHINPNMIKSLSSTVNTTPKKHNVQKITVNRRTIVSTRTKIVRIPERKAPTTIINNTLRKRRLSLKSKYKIVKSYPESPIVNKNSKYKLDNTSSINPALVRTFRKRYVYTNRFVTVSDIAKNIIYKKKNILNISGILYSTTPNSLRKADVLKSVRKTNKKIVKLRNKLDNKVLRTKLRKGSGKLHKCNIPCLVFTKTGKCKRKESGTCYRKHDPDQIALCTRFLQGLCVDHSCLLSHIVSHEKVPTCNYYLKGLCSKDDCPYLHVKINPKADVCRDFLEGFCKKAMECEKRHQFLCPVFEKEGKCPKKNCPYPHAGGLVRNYKVLNRFAKKYSNVNKSSTSSKEEAKSKSTNVLNVVAKSRYYDDDDDKVNGIDCADNNLNCDNLKSLTIRPKLGLLPSFIPFAEK